MKTSEPNPQIRQNGTPYPDIPVFLESKEQDYQGAGIVSTVAIAGHPIHPVIVTVPIGVLVTALASDIGYWLTQDPFWARASLWLIGFGLISGIVAALVGMFDLIGIRRVRKRKSGWAHVFSNAAALLLTALNLGTRLGNPEDPVLYVGLILSVLVAALLGLGGWFGGELVYRHKVANIGPESRDVD